MHAAYIGPSYALNAVFFYGTAVWEDRLLAKMRVYFGLN